MHHQTKQPTPPQSPAYNTGRQSPVYNTGRQSPAYNTGRQSPAYNTGRQSPAPPGAGHPGPKAFTLIELLVVVSIIALFLGLLLVGSEQLLTQGKGQQARVVLQSLAGANQEYQAQTGVVINHIGDKPIDWGSQSGQPGENDDSIEKFVWAMDQLDATQKMLQAISNELRVDKDNDGSGDGFVEIRDPWGTMFKYRQQTGGNVQTNLKRHPRPFFVSAGPDKKFGNDDDLYSFNLD